jgi:(p)ppGpp synthase/HD superfamily hydrolase
MLSKAIRLATELYDGRKRKFTGLPYIVHPLSVMAQVKDHLDYNQDDYDNEYILAAAVLQDVVSECDVSLDFVENQFNKGVRDLIEELTPDKKEMKLDEAKYWSDKMLKMSEDALTIKLCDILETLKITHLVQEDVQDRYNKKVIKIVDALKKKLDMTDVNLAIVESLGEYLC